MYKTNDEELMLLLKTGSETAFNNIFERYRDLMFLEANRRLQSEDEAMDTVQEVFVYLWQKKASVQVKVSLRNYLVQAIRYNCSNKLRAHAMLQKRQQQYAHFKETITQPFPIENMELGMHLNNAINSIAPASRTAFEMLYIQQKSQKEIAAEMGISLFTVKNHIVLALKKLRQNLNKVK